MKNTQRSHVYFSKLLGPSECSDVNSPRGLSFRYQTMTVVELTYTGSDVSIEGKEEDEDHVAG
jgi:hypothetical protein